MTIQNLGGLNVENYTQITHKQKKNGINNYYWYGILGTVNLKFQWNKSSI